MSSVYQQGTGLAIVERFWTVDPLTEVGTLADPTTVTFTLEAPDGTSVSYVAGLASEVSNPDVGVYLLTLDPPALSGLYAYDVVGTGAVAASDEGFFEILPSGFLGATYGAPGACSPWITGDDVARCGPDLGVGSDVWRLEDAAADASLILFELSGRQYAGECIRKVRPCSARCSCWTDYSAAGGWQNSWLTAGRCGELGESCGCSPQSVVKLAGHARTVVQVKIDGTTLSPLDDAGNPNYRLDGGRNLVRMDSPGPPVVRRRWPGCQNLSLTDDQLGTFSVIYKWGYDVPPLGRMAAAQLARELWKACAPDDGDCALPSNVTRVVREGVTIDRVAGVVASLLASGETGLELVDAFIATANPNKVRRQAAIFSPDVQPFAKEE